jgi:hypothetical protein
MARRKRAPRRTDPTENADQAEFAALRMGEAPISAGLIDEKLSGADDDYPGGDKALERDKALEEAEAEAATEIERRARLLGDAYPFRREGSRLIHVPEDPQLYELLLLVSLAEDYSTGRKRLLPRTFEALSCLIAEAYLGDDSASYRIGWPRPRGSATTLKGAIDELRKATGDHHGEWKWGPKEGNPEDPSPQRAKEQGLDIVAWKKSVDGRAGQLYLLGQCACGKNWHTDAKLQDLNTKILNEWVSEIANVDPVRAIFTPRHALDEKLPFISRHGGIVFDRVRLTLLAKRDKAAGVLLAQKARMQHVMQLCMA